MDQSLILNYDWMNNVKSALFDKLNNSPEFQTKFISDTTNTLLHEFYRGTPKPISFGKISDENLLMFNLLKDRDFLTWSEDYKININDKLQKATSLSFYNRHKKAMELFDQTSQYVDTINAILTVSDLGKSLPLPPAMKEARDGRQIPGSGPGPYGAPVPGPGPYGVPGPGPGPQSGLVPLVAVAVAAVAATVVVAFHVKIVHPGPEQIISVSATMTQPVVSVRFSPPVVSVRFSPPVASLRFSPPVASLRFAPTVPRISTVEWGGLTRQDLKITTNLIYKSLMK
ncbi:hypothetical protein JMM81_06685 [Bacillus sp. V3B]|uniref:hypothetical protein n=1 Tax=Bacillus sp. V3B TaxID=2804915 RepID=UPI00210BD97D|nr:hypothetical protein [Bacillus sp. V3B]MCQ6274660.1 hypothetical protein [Bacillus sp. V3B]